MEHQPLADFVSGLSYIYESDPAGYEIDSFDTGNFLLLDGSLTFPDSNDNGTDAPSAGTIHNISEQDSATNEMWAYTGGNVDVAQFASYLASGDSLGLFSLLLTGHDLIAGADGPDHLFGFGGNDTMFGGAGDDRLFATGGNNHLFGGPGNDQLHAGSGNNTLSGGSGADQFWFDSTRTGVDMITDFTPSQHDKIVLSEADFARLGRHGTLSAAHFHLNHAGPGISPEIVYTKGNGFLYYDSNGHLPGGMTHFATLSTHPNIDNTDFLVVA
jgi:Ca2+-binding RTX toxin-like protein